MWQLDYAARKDSSVDIANGYGLEICVYSQHPDQVWGPTNLLYTREHFPNRVKWFRHDVDHSLPASAEVLHLRGMVLN
jgi:hypothetical protein